MWNNVSLKGDKAGFHFFSLGECILHLYRSTSHHSAKKMLVLLSTGDSSGSLFPLGACLETTTVFSFMADVFLQAVALLESRLLCCKSIFMPSYCIKGDFYQKRAIEVPEWLMTPTHPLALPGDQKGMMLQWMAGKESCLLLIWSFVLFPNLLKVFSSPGLKLVLLHLPQESSPFLY